MYNGYGGSEWFRVLSPEVQVNWRGWTATLARLHQEGWEVSVQEDYVRREYAIFIRDKKSDVVGCGYFDDRIMEYLRPQSSFAGRGPKLQVGMKIARDLFLMEAAPMPECTRPVNPMPEFTRFESNASLRNMKIFRDEDTIAEHEVYIDQPIQVPTVSELLQLALEQQEPKQAEIRQAEIRRRSQLKLNVRMAV